VRHIDEEFLQRLSLHEVLKDAHFVGVIGSYAEGLQTSTSDLDLVALGNYEKSSYTSISLDGVRADVWLCSDADIHRLIAVADQEDYANIAPRDLEVIHKALRPRTIRSTGQFEYLSSAFSKDRFQRALADNYMRHAAAIFPDLIGVILDDDAWSIVDFGRSFLRAHIDALLCHCGDTYVKEKWRARRSQRLTGRAGELAHGYAALEVHGPANYGEWRTWLTRLFGISSSIQQFIYFGVSGIVDSASQLRRSSDLMIVRRAGVFYLLGRDIWYQVGAHDAAALLAIPMVAPDEEVTGYGEGELVPKGLTSLQRKLINLGALYSVPRNSACGR
jgi:hypothetical protein